MICDKKGWKMKKILLMIALTLAGFLKTDARHGRMMMFFDIENDETNFERMPGDPPLAADIITRDAVFALYQKTAPVLMSVNLWQAILSHYKQFKEKLNDNNSDEYRYHLLYLKINQYSNRAFYSLASYAGYKKKEKLAQKVQKLVNDDEQFGKEYQNLEKNKFLSVIKVEHDVYVVMNDFFDTKEWDIYNLDGRFLLCIPHVYKEENIYAFKKECNILNISKKISEQMSQFTAEEIALGLQIKRHESGRMKGDFLEDLPLLQENLSEDDQIAIQETPYLVDKLFSTLFIAKADVPDTLKGYTDFILPAWNFLLDGHGAYTELSPELKNALTESEKLYEEVGFFVRGIVKNFSKVQQAKVERLQELEKTIHKMLADTEGTIASLSLPTFSSVLDYLDKNIVTSMLLYLTCIAGGRHLHLPFMNKGIYKTYNFTLISAVSSEVEAVGEMQHFTINNFKVHNFSVTEKGVALSFVGEANCSYKDFFELQEHNASLDKVIKAIIFKKAENVPAIRLPGMTWFSTVHLDEVAYLNKITIGKAMQKETLSLHNVMTVLLYVPYIPLELLLSASSSYMKSSENSLKMEKSNLPDDPNYKEAIEDANRTPLFLSMIPGNALHWIKKISAPDRFFTSFVENILLQSIAGEKIYLIDTLTTINNIDDSGWKKPLRKLIDIPYKELTVFENVAFFNDIVDPLYPKEIKYKVSGVVFTVQNKSYRAIYDKMPLFEDEEELSGEKIPIAEQEGTIEEEPISEEEEIIEEESEPKENGEQLSTEKQEITGFTHERLSPYMPIEEMNDDEFELYQNWYISQKKAAHESADLLTDLSKVETAAYKHIKNVRQKPVSEAEKAWKAKKINQ